MPILWPEDTEMVATAEKSPQKRSERQQTCPGCGVVFVPARNGQRFCKAGCRASSWRADHIITVRAKVGQTIHIKVEAE